MTELLISQISKIRKINISVRYRAKFIQLFSQAGWWQIRKCATVNKADKQQHTKPLKENKAAFLDPREIHSNELRVISNSFELDFFQK